jgi:hypothetical protein
MAIEKFFAPKHDMGKHPSMHCHRARFEASQVDWRARFDLEMIEVYVNHLRKNVEPLGTPGKPELCFDEEKGGHFQDDGETTSQQVLRPLERRETQIFPDETSAAGN